MSWILLTLLSLSAFAGDCALYELQGEVLQDYRAALKVRKGTNSERVFKFTAENQLQMGPYLKNTVRGVFLIQDLTILKIEEVKTVVPDPLHPETEMVKLKSVPCPKNEAKKRAP